MDNKFVSVDLKDSKPKLKDEVAGELPPKTPKKIMQTGFSKFKKALEELDNQFVFVNCKEAKLKVKDSASTKLPEKVQLPDAMKNMKPQTRFTRLEKFLLKICWIIGVYLPKLLGWLLLIVATIGRMVALTTFEFLCEDYFPLVTFLLANYFLPVGCNCPEWVDSYLPVVLFIGAALSGSVLVSNLIYMCMGEGLRKRSPETEKKFLKVKRMRNTIWKMFKIYWIMAYLYLVCVSFVGVDDKKTFNEDGSIEENCTSYFEVLFFALFSITSIAVATLPIVFCLFLGSVIVGYFSCATGNQMAGDFFKLGFDNYRIQTCLILGKILRAADD